MKCFRVSVNIIISFIFIEFFMAIENTVGSYNAQCVLKIKQGNQMLNVLTKSDQGVETIKTTFQ